jgi:hypothetical protein
MPQGVSHGKKVLMDIFNKDDLNGDLVMSHNNSLKRVIVLRFYFHSPVSRFSLSFWYS